MDELVTKLQNELKNESLRSAQQFEQINGELKETDEKITTITEDLAKLDQSKESAKQKKKSSMVEPPSQKEISKMVDLRIEELKKKGMLAGGGGAGGGGGLGGAGSAGGGGGSL